MPRINLPKKPRKYNTKNVTQAREFARKLYASSGWQKLRIQKLIENPLCQECEKNGLIKLGNEVHHIIPFNHERSDEMKIFMFYNYENLLTVCHECHSKLDNPNSKNSFNF